MTMAAAALIVRAFEDEGIRFVFGLPGLDNLELYAALEGSAKVTAVVALDERGAVAMADGVARSSEATGVVCLGPGAGLTGALSGVAEAGRDGTPLLVLATVASGPARPFRATDVDQAGLLSPLVKRVERVEAPDLMYATVRRALRLARSGSPGPVALLVPAGMIQSRLPLPDPTGDFPDELPPQATDRELDLAASAVGSARFPVLYLGNGARRAAAQVRDLAERLSAPVVTSLQGKGVFPERHPLWLWNGFGPHAPRHVLKVMDRCDCLLAIGARFAEAAVAGYGTVPPENLVHVDIDPAVPGRSFPARVPVAADAGEFVRGLLAMLSHRPRNEQLEDEIARGHRQIAEERARGRGPGIDPGAFFSALQSAAGSDALFAAEAGTPLLLAVEHLRLEEPSRLIAPVDFASPGFAIPAAIGARLAGPGRDALAITCEGGLLAGGQELLNAGRLGAAVAVFVLQENPSGEVSGLQQALFGEPAPPAGPFPVDRLAQAWGCHHLRMGEGVDTAQTVAEAIVTARQGEPVIVETALDPTRKSWYSRGAIEQAVGRLPWNERVRLAARAGAKRLWDPRRRR